MHRKCFLQGEYLYHHVITMPEFQVDTLACIIIQFRKFIYQSKLKICENYIYKNTENVIACSDLTMRRRKDHEVIRINCRAYQATKYIQLLQ